MQQNKHQKSINAVAVESTCNTKQRKQQLLHHSLNSHLFSSLKVTIEKHERQFVFHCNLNSLFGISGGKGEKPHSENRKVSKERLKKIKKTKPTISSTIIYYTSIYKR